jgi:signal peptidase I
MRKRKDMPLWQEMLILLAIAFFLAIIVRTFLFQAFYITSGSMQGTLQVGDRVVVNKMAYDFRAPERGEVIVFRGTSSWVSEGADDSNASLFSDIGTGIGNLVGVSEPGKDIFIKRVIGIPGDTVACCDDQGDITVNGVGVNEPYVTMNAPIADTTSNTPTCNDRNFRPVVVQPGMLFVMGDHRLVSQDSRCVGQVPEANVIGRAMGIVWPSSRWTSLSIPPGFKAIPSTDALGPARSVPLNAPATGGAIAIPLVSAFGLNARSRGKWGRRRRTLRA